jgi:hypothetical protein
LLAAEELGKVNTWNILVSVMGSWHGKNELALGGHPLISCFAKSVLKNWNLCPEILLVSITEN